MLTATASATDHRLGFESQPEEVSATPLEVQGEIPSWLHGRLIRVTPGLLEPGGVPVRHWFDGLAVLHAFTIGDDRVTYADHAIDSRARRDVLDHGETQLRGFATDPCRSIFKKVTAIFDPHQTDNCNVNVSRLGDQWLALTETPIAIEFDPETLATLGRVDWAGRFDQGTAHPHYDFERSEAISYSVRFGRKSSYRIFATPDRGSRREVARVPASEPAYMHSFGLTQRFAVLLESPLVVDPLQLMFGGRSFIESYEWKPERGSCFTIVDRESGRVRARLHADPFFSFHFVNVFEDDGELVADVVAYEDPSIIDALFLDRLRAGETPQTSGSLHRYRLPLDGGNAAREVLAEGPFELPRIAYRRHNGRPYRYAYGTGAQPGGFFDQIEKVCVDGAPAMRWSEPGCFPSEPVFADRPDAAAEDDGVLLSVVLDASAGRSFLLVLDASDMSELARAYAPHHIPFGFHGDFASEG